MSDGDDYSPPDIRYIQQALVYAKRYGPEAQIARPPKLSRLLTATDSLPPESSGRVERAADVFDREVPRLIAELALLESEHKSMLELLAEIARGVSIGGTAVLGVPHEAVIKAYRAYATAHVMLLRRAQVRREHVRRTLQSRGDFTNE